MGTFVRMSEASMVYGLEFRGADRKALMGDQTRILYSPLRTDL